MHRTARNRNAPLSFHSALFVILLFGLFLGLPTLAGARDFYVSESGSGTKDGLNPANAYGSIQDAIWAASNGDKILVAAGTYTSPTHFNTSIKLKYGISLLGAGSSNTTLKGSRTGPVIIADGTPSVVISGFTITGGGGKYVEGPDGNCGGGIYVKSGSITIQNNVITGNSVDRNGGGIYSSGTNTGQITNNIISNNIASAYGGGIFFSGSNPAISNNIIRGNDGDYGGGAIYCDTGNDISAPLIVNNTITANKSRFSGGIGVGYRSRPVVVNCIIWGNQVSDYSYGYGGPQEATYSCIGTGLNTGTTNITTDPLWVDAPNGNYQLRVDSPVVNKGTKNIPAYPSAPPVTDILGVARPTGAGVDMGAYERAATELTAPIAGINNGEAGVTYLGAVAQGTTTAVKTPLGTVEPPADMLPAGDAHYEITSTADFTNLGFRVTLAFDGAGMSDAEKMSVRLFHYTGGAWVDITDSGQPNVGANTVTGTATSFSPFGAFYTEDAEPPVPVPASSTWSLTLLVVLAAGLGMVASKCAQRD